MANKDTLKKLISQMDEAAKRKPQPVQQPVQPTFDENIMQKTAALLNAMDEQRKEEAALLEKERKSFINGMGNAIVETVKPLLDTLTKQSKISKEEIKDALSNVKVQAPEVVVPPISVPKIEVPTPKVTVKTPAPIVNIPPVKFPEQMEVSGDVGLRDVGLDRPLPVQLRAADGSPLDLQASLTQVVGGGGGKADYFTIREIQKTVSATLTDAEGVPFGASNPLDVDGTVAVSGITGTIAANIVDSTGEAYTTSNPLPISDAGGNISVDGTVAVSGITGTVGANIVDSGGVAYTETNPLPVIIGDGIDEIDILQEGADNYANATKSIPVTAFNYGYEGGSWDRLMSTSGALNVADGGGSLSVDDAGGTLGVDDNGGSLTVDGTVTVSGITNSVGAGLVDSTGVQYSGSNPLPVLTTPVAVTSALTTAYAALTNGTETTFATAVAGKYLDMIYVMGANVSDVATTVTLRANTGGNAAMVLQLPANGTAGVATPVPFPQMGTSDGSGNNWTADLDDITGTTVYLTGLFKQR